MLTCAHCGLEMTSCKRTTHDAGYPPYCCRDACRQADMVRRRRRQGQCAKCGRPSPTFRCPTCQRIYRGDRVAQEILRRARQDMAQQTERAIDAVFRRALWQAKKKFHVDGWERR